MSSTLQSILCDRRAMILFTTAAICVIPLTGLLVLTITPVYDQFRSDWVANTLLAFVETLMWVSFVVSGMVIFFGMVAYLLAVDQTSWKLGWLVVFLLTSSVGAAIYCLTVYRKQRSLVARA